MRLISLLSWKRKSAEPSDEIPVWTERQWEERLGQPWSEVRRRWGFERLRDGQARALQAIAQGHDVLAVMPTGSGKSLIYQLGAHCRAGLTVVVSPLIALMSDQLRSLAARGVAAVALNSQQSEEENACSLERALSGEVRLLYLAPERLRSDTFRAAAAGAPLGLFVVDEAHCITEWGHDFRPDYLALKRCIAELGRPPVAAFTATATPQARREIAEHLGLVSPSVVTTGFDRPNLAFACRPCPPERKLATLTRLLERRTGPALVYAGTRRATEEIAEALPFSCPVLTYHGGMTSEARERALRVFTTAPDLVMVATNAFGMGVDRPDLGLVIHHSMPGSLEAYYQEAGRAGRGGQNAAAALLYDPSDRRLHDYFIGQGCWEAAGLQALIARAAAGERGFGPRERSALELLVRLGALDERLKPLRAWDAPLERELMTRVQRVRRMRLMALEAMIGYATTTRCRRRVLVGHFGESAPPRRRTCCDNCGF